MLVFALIPSLLGAPQSGLLGRFSDGTRTVRFVAAAPHFYLDPQESIHPRLAPAFSGEWTGQLHVLMQGGYEFSMPVSLNGRVAARHTLDAGAHALSIAYRRSPGAASLRLLWRGPGFEWEPVPRSAFLHEPEAADAAELGRSLVMEARCAACHRISGPVAAIPSLRAIGDRAHRTWLYHKLRQHHGGTPAEAASLAAWLATQTSGTKPPPRKVHEVLIGKGGELFGTLGCVSCHQLTGLGSKTTLDAATQALLESHRPRLALSAEDATALAAYLTRSRDAAFEAPAPAGDAAQGPALLDSLGCNGCHEQRRAQAAVRGDLCRQVRTGWDDSQRAAVRAFLAVEDRSPAPVYELPYQLRKHQCLECHRTGTEAPALEGAGDKLKTAWIGEVLWGSQRIRPGRELRMPHYDEAAMRPWVASFAKAEGLAPGGGPAAPAFTDAQRTTGLGLLGTNARKRGMACIGCHDWGEYKSLGEEGPQLRNATRRLRWDWYERWMRNPARIVSGTSMPNYFGALFADAAREPIHTLWAALAWGEDAPVPDGYRTSDLEVTSEARPVPGKEAVVVRWDMPEATPAAIAVGLPGGLSYCFDAGQSRLLYAWRGGFLDLTGTLLRKTDSNRLTPTATITGEMFWRAGAEFPIRIGAAGRKPEMRFRGYHIVDGVPEFRYLAGGIEVRERLSADGGKLRRAFLFDNVTEPVTVEGHTLPQGRNVRWEMTLP